MRGVTGKVNRKIDTIDISTHTPHARRDVLRIGVGRCYYPFQLTRLMRGVTMPHFKSSLYMIKFQLTRLMRGVTREMVYRSPSEVFQLTRLMRGVTRFQIRSNNRIQKFQLTRLMRGVTEGICSHRPFRHISTHTPHARRDASRFHS